MDAISVNLTGIILIGLIVWWFWLSKPKARSVQSNAVVDVLVDSGVYTPSRIEVSVGMPLTLRFLRKDPNPCAETVVFDEFGLSVDLPINKAIEVTVTPDRPGEFVFTCQMQMYRGSLVAKDEKI